MIERLLGPKSRFTTRDVVSAVLEMLGRALEVSAIPGFVAVGRNVERLAHADEIDATEIDTVRATIDTTVEELQSRFGEVDATSREAYFLRLLNLVELGLDFIETEDDRRLANWSRAMEDHFAMMNSLTDDGYEESVLSSIGARLDGAADADDNVLVRDALIEVARRPLADDA